MNGGAAYCRSIGEDDDFDVNFGSLALFDSSSRRADAHQRACFCPGTPARLPKGFTEKIANVDGVKINYKTGGRGPVVVLLHGYTQTSHMWIPLMPLLAASHTVIAPDLRGAGNSERAKAGYDKKTLAKDVRTLVRRTRL